MRVILDYKHGELTEKDEAELKESVPKALCGFWRVDASRVKFERPQQPISKSAVDCTLHLDVQLETDEPLHRLLTEMSNPYSELRQAKFLSKAITVDVKNKASACKAYQAVLALLPERDQLLHDKDMAILALFQAKKAAEQSRVRSLSAEMDAEFAHNALLSRKIQLQTLDQERSQQVAGELRKVEEKLKEMISSASILASTTLMLFTELEDLRRSAMRASERYTDFSSEFSAACYAAMTAGRAGYWEGELQRHEASEFRYALPAESFVSSDYLAVHIKGLEVAEPSHNRVEDLPSDYDCAHGCGFAGLYHVVAKHELTCPVAVSSKI